MRSTEPDHDIPGSRHALETVARPFNIYFLLTMALLSGALFLAGLVQMRVQGSPFLERLPEPVLLLTVGVALFFPWFTALYFARHLLVSIQRLEAENARLRGCVADVGRRDG